MLDFWKSVKNFFVPNCPGGKCRPSQPRRLRVGIMFEEQSLDRLQAMREATGAIDTHDLIVRSLALYDLLLQETARGNRVYVGTDELDMRRVELL